MSTARVTDVEDEGIAIRPNVELHDTATAEFEHGLSKSDAEIGGDEEEEEVSTLTLKHVQTVAQIDSSGDKEQSPVEPAFANTKAFWICFAAALVIGVLLGLLALGYIKAVDDVVKQWSQYGNEDYPDSADTLKYAKGKPWWIALSTGMGLLVGLLRSGFLHTVPALELYEYPSFADELRHREVEPWTAIRVTVYACISLMGGACLGPEAGLGAAGSLFGHMAGQVLKRLKLDKDVDHKELVGAGSTGALAPMLPSPFLGVILCAELCGWPTSRGAALMLATAAAAFAVYIAITLHTYFEATTLLVLAYEEERAHTYDWAIGCCFGLMGGVIALCHFLVGAIVKNIFNAIREKLDASRGKHLRMLVSCTLAGLIAGLMSYLFPLTLSSGSALVEPVASLGDELSAGLLVASIFAKSFSFWCCSEGGLVGGIVFPLLLMGTMAGSVAATSTGVERGIATQCSFVAVAASFVPFPVFWILLSFLVFPFGSQALFPLYTTAGTAYLLFVGVGIPQSLLALADRKRARKEEQNKNKV